MLPPEMDYRTFTKEIDSLNRSSWFANGEKTVWGYLWRSERNAPSLRNIHALLTNNLTHFYHYSRESNRAIPHQAPQSPLHNRLRVLESNIAKLPDSAEKKSILDLIHQIIKINANTLSAEELILNQIEVAVPRGYFHFNRESNGRIPDPKMELARFRELIGKSHILSANFTAEDYIEEARDAVDHIFLKFFSRVFGEGRTHLWRHEPDKGRYWLAHTTLNNVPLEFVDTAVIPPEVVHFLGAHPLRLRCIVENNYRPLLEKLKALDSAKFDGVTALHLDGSEIPPEVYQFPNVEQLTLSDFHKNELPPEIFRWTQLTNLSLNNTDLYDLPVEIRNLQSLRTLDISNNPALIQLPSFAKLTSLEKIICDERHLSLLQDIKGPPLIEIEWKDSAHPSITHRWRATDGLPLVDFLRRYGSLKV